MPRFFCAPVLLVFAVSACGDDNPPPTPDAGRVDAGRADAGRVDSGPPDAGCNAGMMCTPARECFGGFIRCEASGPVCTENMPLPAGTICSMGQCDALGECITAQSSRLMASDADRADAFGGALDIDGDRLVVGVGDTIAGVYADAAYILERQTDAMWNEVAILETDDPTSGLFGLAVSLDGDRALIASPGASHSGEMDAGAAYVFERQTDESWMEVARLIADDPAMDAHLGRAVALSADIAAVGQNQGGGGDQGAVYVFERQGDGSWMQIQKLASPEPEADDGFGEAVALSGDFLVVGATDHDTGAGTDSGVAYAFERQVDGTFAPAATIAPAEGAADDGLGAALAYDGTFLAIIAPGADAEAARVNVGAVYVFERMASSFTPVVRLIPSDAMENDLLESVDHTGDRLLVGAPLASRADATEAGRVYSFQRQGDGTYMELGQLSPTDGVMGDRFGVAVATNGTLGVVGSIGVTIGGEDDSGAVYVYDPL